jgi:DNA-binding LacI/PurR family transcriptional regulator
MAVTLTDVAKAAGVSASTVSRALSRPERVDAATRARIFQEIERLGYQPNLAARSLITGRTGNLGVIVPDLANPFFPDVVKAVQLQARQRGFTVLLADSEEDPAAELDLINSLAPQVDGIVLCGARMSDDELGKAQQLAPVMLINRIAPGIPAVKIDNADGTRQAVRHLRALRHRRFGFVGGPVSSRSHQQRLAGAQAAAEEFGMDLIDLGSVAPSFDGGSAAADAVLLAEVSAVLAYNDVIAIGLMHRLVSYGIAVPDEISVIGFDDIALAAMSYPALTTVRYPRELAGQRAVDDLLDLLSGEGADRDGAVREPLPTELIIRGSTTRRHTHPEETHGNG